MSSCETLEPWIHYRRLFLYFGNMGDTVICWIYCMYYYEDQSTILIITYRSFLRSRETIANHIHCVKQSKVEEM